MSAPSAPAGDASAALQTQLTSQAEKVRELKAAKAPKDEVDGQVKILLDLKKQMAALNVGSSSASSSKQPVKFTLKTAKGTRDWEPLAMSLRAHIFRVIEDVFKQHGAVTIDTPVFELKEILSGKYGEDSKLIYDLQDQGGELCSLRYDLTVPFARFVAMNPTEYGQIKRYHIAKVYRRDQPAMAKGRFREFYQCDFDISGVYDPLLPDSEILLVLTKALNALGIRQFTIKLNHRALLDGLFAVCGVPEDKIRTISSAVDKLDKAPWADVKAEMLEKGLAEEAADAIGVYVSRKGGKELLEDLLQDPKLSSNASAKKGLDELKTLFEYLDILEVTPKISFDLSLARGLDYYTGIIYEAVTEGSAPPPTTTAAGAETGASKASAKKSKSSAAQEDDDASASVGVGSIAAGGRYDNLVGMFSGSKGSSGQVPCVGVSIGVERVFSIMMARLAKVRAEEEAAAAAASSSSSTPSAGQGLTGIRAKETECFIMSMGRDGMTKERMLVAKQLWSHGIKAEYAYKLKPKLPQQFNVIAKESIPFAVILAPDEWNDPSGRKVRVKEQQPPAASSGSIAAAAAAATSSSTAGSSQSQDSKGELVALESLGEYVKEKLAGRRLSSVEILRKVMGIEDGDL
ncbi:unnamed protein product [Parajaminaea phylloscopi]